METAQYPYSKSLQILQRNAIRFADKAAIISGEEQVNYETLWLNIRKAAAWLAGRGFKKDDRVVLCAKKELHYVYMYYATMILGLIHELSDPDSNAETLVYDKDEVLSCEPYEGWADGVREHDITEILHTTGTTSRPKSVCLSHFNIYWAAKNTSDFVQNDENDVEVVVMPICHAFGCRRLTLTLMNGATAVLLPNFANVQLLLKTIEKFRVTTWGMAPAAWSYVRKISGTRIGRFKDQIRHIEFGTAAMTMAGKEDILSLLPNTRICHNYGLTESNRSAMIEYHDTEHLNSIGRPIADNVEIRVIDGEICVHGNQTMECYLDPEDNAEAFVDGFFRTGDCGYISDEGYIYLTGRAKEMISVGGKKVSPVEVEEAICNLGVGDCICVSHPDSMLGETVKAYILKGSTELSLDEIDVKMNKLFSQEIYKCPTEYEWIDRIPVNSLGKKQRRALTEV